MNREHCELRTGNFFIESVFEHLLTCKLIMKKLCCKLTMAKRNKGRLKTNPDNMRIVDFLCLLLKLCWASFLDDIQRFAEDQK